MRNPSEDAAKNQCNTRELAVDSPCRLDLFLLGQLPDYSRDGLMRLLARGQVGVNGEIRFAGYRLRDGDRVTLPGALEALHVPASDGALRILYEDEDLIAIDKPAGLLAHPTPFEREDTALNRLRGRLRARVSLLHRLDRATSGVLVAAKSRTAAARYGALFEARQVCKRYLAVAAGIPDWKTITARQSIQRQAGRTPPWNLGGDRPAETRLRVLDIRDGRTLLAAEPVTGRTNQIRIHCAAEGLPLLGDTPYGGASADRLFLHAVSIELEGLQISAPVPAAFDTLFSSYFLANSSRNPL